MDVKLHRFSGVEGPYRVDRCLAGEALEVFNAVFDIAGIRGCLEDLAVDVFRRRSLDQRAVEGQRDVRGLGAGTGERNVVGFEGLRSNDLKVTDDVLNRAGDGVGAVSADGNLPLGIDHGVVARGALDGILCEARCLLHELVLI